MSREVVSGIAARFAGQERRDAASTVPNPRSIPQFENRGADPLSGPCFLLYYCGRCQNASRFVFSLSGMPLVIVPADREAALFSFYNLSEAHILSVTTRVHKLKLKRVRYAMKELQALALSNQRHPLLSREFYTDGRDLFVKTIEKENQANNQYLSVRPTRAKRSSGFILGAHRAGRRI